MHFYDFNTSSNKLQEVHKNYFFIPENYFFVPLCQIWNAGFSHKHTMF